MGKFIFSAILLGIGACLVGGVVGMILDTYIGSSPWLALAGSFLGLSVSFFAVQVAVQRIFNKTAPDLDNE